MIEINLVPDVKQELIHAQRVRLSVITISIIAGIAAIAIVIVLALLLGVQGARGFILDRSIDTNSKKLSNVSDINKTLTIQNQLDKISSIHESSHVDSRIFNVLTSLAKSGGSGDTAIQYTNVVVDTDGGTVTVQAQTPTFNGLDAFKKTLAATNFQYTSAGSSDKQTTPLASNISLTSQSQALDASGKHVVSFILDFTYAPELLSPQSKNAQVILPTSTNATDSYEGIPASLFTEKAGGQ